MSACALLIGLVGCSTPPSAYHDAPVDTGKVTHRFLSSPKLLRDESCYPPDLSRQLLRWTKKGFEWHIHAPTTGYAYVAVVFRRPVDGLADRNETDLSLTIEPQEIIPSISMALVDSITNSPRVLVDRPLAKYVTSKDNGHAHIRIPLAAFSDRGISTNGHTTALFDWQQIQELRIILNGRRPGKEIIIHDLQLIKHQGFPR